MGRSKGITPTTGLIARAYALVLPAATVLLATGPAQALPGFAPKAIHAEGSLVLAQAVGLKAGTNLNRTYIRRPSIQNKSLAITPNATRRVPLKNDLSRTTKGAPKTARPRVFGTSGLETGLAQDSRLKTLNNNGQFNTGITNGGSTNGASRGVIKRFLHRRNDLLLSEEPDR